MDFSFLINFNRWVFGNVICWLKKHASPSFARVDLGKAMLITTGKVELFKISYKNLQHATSIVTDKETTQFGNPKGGRGVAYGNL